MDSGKAALGVIAGIAAGALLGILFAPAKGSVTRRRIANKGEELTDELKEKFEEVLDTIANKYDQAKKSVAHSLSE